MHEALESICSVPSIKSSFTHITIVLMSLSDVGADVITLFAPAFKCLNANFLVLKLPVRSRTTSIFNSFHVNFSYSEIEL